MTLKAKPPNLSPLTPGFLFFSNLFFFLTFPLVEVRGEFTIRSKIIEGASYVYIDDLSRYFGLQITKSEKSVFLANSKIKLQFPLNSRKAYVNSIVTHLSFASRLNRNSIFLSEQDFSLLIDPIVRDASLPKENINRVVIDPGHGGKDKGAIGSKVLEKDINLILAKKLESLLAGKGYQVLLTRKSDKYISLSDRGKITKNWRGDLFISIHCNAAANKSVTGIESFIVTPKGSPSSSKTRIQTKKVPGNSFDKLNSRLSYEVQKRLISITGAPDRGIKYYRWQVLREASCPAILVETGFLSNLEEERKLANPDYQNKIALAMTTGIVGLERAIRVNK